MTVPRKFKQIVEEFPDRPAFINSKSTLSYAEIDEKSNQLGFYLMEQGVTVGTVVGIMMDKSVDYLLLILAISKIGGVYAPFDLNQPMSRIEQMCVEAKLKFVVVQNNFSKKLDSNINYLPFPDYNNFSKHLVYENVGIEPTDPLYIMFTSGSTGIPKGVIIPHQGVVRLVCNSNYIDIVLTDVFFQISSLAFDGCAFEIWGALLNGAGLVIPEHNIEFALMGNYLKAFKINILWVTSRLFDAYIDADVSLFEQIKYFVFGGEAASFYHVKKAFEQLPKTTFLNGYGPTENSTFTLAHKVTKDDLDRGFIPIGEPISETECFVLNENLEVLGPNEEGVLYTSGKGLAIGYTNEVETNKKFIFHPSLQKRLYNIGDRVKYHKNVGYEYLGRIDRQVKIRGLRIELIEVENAMLKCEDVSVSIAVFNRVLQKNELAVFYATFSKKPIEEQSFRKQLAELVSEYAIPTHYFFVNEFPLKTTGKVDLEKLIEEKIQSFKKAENTLTENDPLKKIWQQILKIESIEDDTHFFESGGNSLDAVVLLFEVEKAMGIKLSENYLFSYPLFKDFKRNISNKNKDSLLIELKKGKNECPIYFIPFYNGTGWLYNSIAHGLKTDRALYSFDKFVPAKFTVKNNIITYLANKYVSEIVKKHSVNRVILAGSSLGGNIATEMAKLLEKKSIIVEQIHLFDSIETSYYRSKNQSKSEEGAPSKL